MKNKNLLLSSIFFLILFICLTLLISIYKESFIFDEMVNLWINNITTPFLMQLMTYLTKVGDTEVIIILTFCITLMLIYKKDFPNTIFFLILSIGGVTLNFLLKIFFQRERPDELNLIEVFNFSIQIPSYSFPSGHTMRTVILFGFLMYLGRRITKGVTITYLLYFICLLVIIGVSFSRIFLDFHYFTDVISAISISLAWFFSLLYLKRFFHKKKNKFSLTEAIVEDQ